jgi:hypothetical protein
MEAEVLEEIPVLMSLHPPKISHELFLASNSSLHLHVTFMRKSGASLGTFSQSNALSRKTAFFSMPQSVC